MPQFPTQDWHNENRNANVRSDKVRCAPVALEEDGETGNQRDDGRSNEADPCGIWLEGRFPGQCVPGDTLCFHRGVEADVAEGESGPCDQPSNGTQVEKPGECLCGTASSKT